MTPARVIARNRALIPQNWVGDKSAVTSAIFIAMSIGVTILQNGPMI